MRLEIVLAVYRVGTVLEMSFVQKVYIDLRNCTCLDLPVRAWPAVVEQTAWPCLGLSFCRMLRYGSASNCVGVAKRFERFLTCGLFETALLCMVGKRVVVAEQIQYKIPGVQ